MWGQVQWSDIFEPERSHAISICVLLNPTAETSNGQVLLSPSPYRNDCSTNK
jgi:hypothetical protein